MLRTELEMCEEQLTQARLLMAQVQKDGYEQARREEELRRRLERHDDDLVRARAATEAARYAQHTCIYTYTYPAMVGYAQASMRTPLPEP